MADDLCELEHLYNNPRKLKELEIKNSLTLPYVILQLILDNKNPPKKLIQEALSSLSEISKEIEKL